MRGSLIRWSGRNGDGLFTQASCESFHTLTVEGAIQVPTLATVQAGVGSTTTLVNVRITVGTCVLVRAEAQVAANSVITAAASILTGI